MGYEIHEEATLALPDERAREYIRASKAERTRRAYAVAWRGFTAWCEGRGLGSLPAAPGTVALYLAARADEGCKPATVALDLATISEAHRAAGFPSPREYAAVRAVLQGIRRTAGVAQRRAAPLLPDDLRAGVGVLGPRDRALLLLGFAGAFRRSELVGLDVEDLAFTADGLEVTLRRSKTDQEGEGQKRGVPFGGDPLTCPVRAVRAWIEGAGLAAGPLFPSGSGRLSDRAVARCVKRAVRAAGLDPSRYSGHSLRAGLATAAARAGKSTHSIMRQTGHRSVAMVSRYVREATLFEDNAACGIGL